MTDYLEPVGVPFTFIYQHLENITNESVYSTLLVSIKGYVCIILKIDQDILLTVQTSFAYLQH